MNTTTEPKTRLTDRAEELGSIAKSVAWSLGKGRKEKNYYSVRGKFSRELGSSFWDCMFTREDLHIESKGHLIPGCSVASEIRIVYQGELVLSKKEEKSESTLSTYVPGVEWEQKLERFFYESS